jgi:hypothetical protein
MATLLANVVKTLMLFVREQAANKNGNLNLNILQQCFWA